MIDKVKKIKVNDVDYFLVSDFYKRSTGTIRPLSTLIDKIPISEIYYPTKRGRGAACYATYNGIKKMISALPRFPLAIKAEFGIYESSTSEQEFEYIIKAFCDEFGFDFQRQVLCLNYNIDFVVNGIAIEYLENHHKGTEEQDNNRYKDIKQYYRKLIIIKESDNIGYVLAQIFKEATK